VSEIEIQLPIHRVTAYEDRAELERVCDVALEPGGAVLRARDLTPLLSEARVTARLEGVEGVVDEVRVEHHYIEDKRTSSERLSELQEDVRAKQDLARAARQARQRLEARRGALRQSQATWSTLVGRGLGRGSLPDDWAGGLDAFLGKLTSLDAEIDDARRTERAAERDLADASTLVDEASERKLRLVADLVARVSGNGGAGRLVVRAVVPCGLWRPTHEARLQQEEESEVQFDTFGSVWQKTGEDWDDVELVLSTARPSAGARLPDLGEDILYLRDKTAEERKRIFVEHRLESIPSSDLRSGAPGVYDGGMARTFTARGKVTIPADGRPHRVAVHDFSAPAVVDRVAMPELDEHVFLRAVFRNNAPHPVLAGPVTLLIDGSYVGVGDVPYVAPGDDIELGFGSDDRFVLKFDRKRITEKRRLAKDRDHFLEEVEVSYSGAGACEAAILLRLPKSELKQLRVVVSERHAAPPDPIADKHGVVRYPIRVEAGKPEKITLAFHFDTSGDVHVPDPW
jgi:uncharacterized protein (TIGR02231 family)